jgi:uncharacterized protein (DUF2147 family)
MKLRPPLIIVVLSGLLVLPSSAFADPIGHWRVAEGDAVVRIQKCGVDVLCGYVSSTTDPAQRDVRNPDPSKRDRTIVGVEVLVDLKKENENTWAGTSYNVEIGQTFSAKVTQRGDDAVEVEGCAPGGESCGTETWTRVKE